MFKIGEKVQCVSKNIDLEYGKMYIITKCYYDNQAEFSEVSESSHAYFSFRFKSIKEIRKEKIKKLNNV